MTCCGSHLTLWCVDIASSAEDVSLSRIVFHQTTNFKAGYHEIPIQAKQLPADQILYYQLKTDQHMATRKMLLQKQ